MCSHICHQLRGERDLSHCVAARVRTCMHGLELITALLALAKLFVSRAARTVSLRCSANFQFEVRVLPVCFSWKDHVLLLLHNHSNGSRVGLLTGRNIVRGHFIFFYGWKVVCYLSNDLPRLRLLLFLFLICIGVSTKLWRREKDDKDLLDLSAQVIDEHLQFVLDYRINEILVFNLRLENLTEGRCSL